MIGMGEVSELVELHGTAHHSSFVYLTDIRGIPIISGVLVNA